MVQIMALTFGKKGETEKELQALTELPKKICNLRIRIDPEVVEGMEVYTFYTDFLLPRKEVYLLGEKEAKKEKRQEKQGVLLILFQEWHQLDDNLLSDVLYQETMGRHLILSVSFFENLTKVDLRRVKDGLEVGKKGKIIIA